MPSGVPLNDVISTHFTVPSPGAVNDKVRAYFDQWYFGTGSPEGAVVAPTGSLYIDKNGTTTILYQKQSGAGNTGWAALGGASAPLNLEGAAAATDLITGKVTGDAFPRMTIDGDGSYMMGVGTAAPNAGIRRDASRVGWRTAGATHVMLDFAAPGGADSGLQMTFYDDVGGGATIGRLLTSRTSAGLRSVSMNAVHHGFAIEGAGAQTGSLLLFNDSARATLFQFDANGFPKWIAAKEQTTVGAAGGASALPATPTKYLQVKDSAGTTLVVPAFAQA